MLVALSRQRRALHRVAGTLLRSAQPALANRFLHRRKSLHIPHFQRPGQRRDRPHGRNGHQPLDTFCQALLGRWRRTCVASIHSEYSDSRGSRVDNAEQTERARRDALKTRRDKLFAQYLRFPGRTELSLEIKLIDDDIARSVEKSDRKSNAPKDSL